MSFRSNHLELTNRGQFAEELENKLCKYLGVSHINLFSSGTLALTLALKALNMEGEVITTPFTHISTLQAIYWNNLRPVFVDINKSTLNIDPLQIEKAIGPDTCSILPVHIFGNPCEVEAINDIAQKYNLKVIYDAAHCFGVKIGEGSLCNYGDLSVLSFHATKVFNCIEGGAVICHNLHMKNKLDALSNSGIDKNYKLIGYGLNAKMNEFEAACGIVNLKNIEKAIEKRKTASILYRKLLKNIDGIITIAEHQAVNYNYSYFPIIIDPNRFNVSTEKVIAFLEEHNVFPKRYFYPLATYYPEFKRYKKLDLTIAELISRNIVCLPLSNTILQNEIEYTTNLLDELYISNRKRTTHNSQ